MNANASRRVPLGWALRIAQWLEFPHKLGICERLFARALSRYGVAWVDTAAGVPWKLDLALSTHRWIVYGKYEGSPFLDWARGHLPRNGIVVDSGANIGQMLLYLAQWVPEGKVLAVEPGAYAGAWLQECLDANPRLHVEVIRCALGSAERGMALGPVGSTDVRGACNQIKPPGGGEPVRVRPLADVLRDRGIGQVDLWKLDVEGYELEAIAGAEPLLRKHRIAAAYVELGFGNGDAIRKKMAALGYRCHLFDSGGRLHVPEHLPAHVNGLFLPQ